MTDNDRYMELLDETKAAKKRVDEQIKIKAQEMKALEAMSTKLAEEEQQLKELTGSAYRSL
jgi:hypothetical protein